MNIALVLAAGKGTRMGAAIPKQFIEYKEKPILVHTLEAFAKHSDVHKICVICPADNVEYTKELLQEYNIPKIAWVEAGGASRRESSYIGVARLAKEFGENDVVMIHDGARPNVSERIISENIEAAAKFGACETAIPSQDTIAVSEDGQKISGIPDRSKMYNVQTPQSFKIGIILKAHQSWMERDGGNATDDAALVMADGLDVYLVKGEKNNLKITTEEDLRILYSIT
ncbi:MAG: 2-C-methyl-D-erythritol 4-phosphate cytidylyltransferase [Ruminococcaceae bacterium]|nr:2-C-methyl-D-erythritol 4-phosphate cytidylyltransferase [Oscillospiraceae bacterium]